MKSCQDADSA